MTHRSFVARSSHRMRAARVAQATEHGMHMLTNVLESVRAKLVREGKS